MTVEETRPAPLIVRASTPSDMFRMVPEGLKFALPSSVVWGQQTKHFQMAAKRIMDVCIASAILVVLRFPDDRRHRGQAGLSGARLLPPHARWPQR
jgi:hypothetical protein